MNENLPDVPDWMIRLIEDADRMWRENMPLIRAAQQYMESARTAWAMAAPLLAYADQVARAADAGMAQLAAAGWQRPGRRTVSAGASLTVTPIMVAEAKVTRATETETDTDSGLDVSRRDAAGSIDGVAFALIVLWLVALAMPAAQVHLSPEVQQILLAYYATISTALIVTWRVQDKRKR
jgi:hypothetical protein